MLLHEPTGHHHQPSLFLCSHIKYAPQSTNEKEKERPPSVRPLHKYVEKITPPLCAAACQLSSSSSSRGAVPVVYIVLFLNLHHHHPCCCCCCCRAVAHTWLTLAQSHRGGLRWHGSVLVIISYYYMSPLSLEEDVLTLASAAAAADWKPFPCFILMMPEPHPRNYYIRRFSSFVRVLAIRWRPFRNVVVLICQTMTIHHHHLQHHPYCIPVVVCCRLWRCCLLACLCWEYT